MIFDIIGWIGMILVIVPYLLLSLNKIENGVLYQLLNLLSSLLMAIGLYSKNAWFSFALQIIWGIVAILGLIKLSKNKSN